MIEFTQLVTLGVNKRRDEEIADTNPWSTEE